MNRTTPRIVARNASACLLSLAALFAVSTRAEVLSVLPSDALVVIKVKDLAGVSKKVAALSERCGLSALQPQMADPIGAIKQDLNIKGGLNESGDAAFAILNIESDEPQMVTLLPVADYAAFLTNFEGASTENGITTFTNAAGGETVYVASWGNYAAISPVKSIVEAQGQGITLPASANAELAAKDAVMFANIPVIKTKVLPTLTEEKAEWRQQLISGLEQDENAKKFAPLLGAAFDVYFQAAETFLNETQGSFISINITDAGANFSVVSEFTQGSYIGNFVSSLKGGTSSYLSGLPASSYLFYGGFPANSAALKPVMKDVLDPILAALPELTPEAKTALDEVRSSFDTMMDSGAAATFGVIKPKGQLGQEAIFQSLFVVEGKPEAYIPAMKKYFASTGTIVKSLMPEGAPAMPGTSFIIEDKALTAGGVSFDRIKADVNAEPKTPEEAQMQQVMSFMYGPAGLSYVIGAADDKHAIFAQGVSDEALAAAVEATKAGQDNLSSLPHIAETAAQLPADRIGVVYVAVDEIATTAIGYVSQFGMPVKFQLPPNLPPLGVAVSASSNTMRVEYHIPSKTVESFVAAALQAMNDARNGGM